MFAEEILIVRGSKKNINLYFVDDKTERPYDLSGITEIKVAFPKEVGVLTKKLTIADVSIIGVPQLGQVLCTLQGADTADLKLCRKGKEVGISFTVELVFPSGPEYFNFDNMIFVEDPKVTPA